MHAYFLTRGIMNTREDWVDFMKTRMFPWKRKNIATGQWETKMVRGALRPIEVWEYVFPEECLQEVMAMQHRADGKFPLITFAENNGALRPEIKNYAVLLQKLMNLKPLPKFDKPTAFGYRSQDMPDIFPVNWVPTDGFAVYPLGIKEDVKQDYPDFIEPNAPKGFYQEGL